jgi:hypothetical protein
VTIADLPLFAGVHHDAPETSHAAASSVRQLREKQQAVLDVLRQYGALTDEELIHAYHNSVGMPACPQSDSGIRTRRKELQTAGLVKPVGERRNRNGRRCTVWIAV